MKKSLWFLMLFVLICMFALSACDNDTGNLENPDIEQSGGNQESGESNKTEIVFDVSKLANISSQQLVTILGEPDNITNTTYYGFVEFPYTVYDYENHELGFIQIDLINDKVTAFTINGELPYNNGNVLETLNVTVTNSEHFSESDMYKKWQCPNTSIDLLHIALIDTDKDSYRSLTVEFDSMFYNEWPVPVGATEPSEYRVITEDLVKSCLTSPKTADFPWLDWTYKKNDYYFYVSSYVDSQNAFGAEIRNEFTFIFKADTTMLVYAELCGNVIINEGYVPTADLIKAMFGSAGGNTTPSNPSVDLPSIPNDEYALYTDADLPISLNYNSKEIFVNNIEYIFCDIDEDTCTFCISLDLISDYNVEDFKIAFSLIGENTNTVREYVLEDINVYGFDGNYISLDGDFIGELPADDYTIVFEKSVECTHSYGSWQSEIPSTCTTAGTKGHYICGICQQYFDEAYTIITDLSLPLKKHSYGDWVDKVDATCYEVGTLGHYTCSECSKHFDENSNQIVDLTIDIFHNYVNNVCPSCNKIDYSTDLDFTIGEGGLYYVVTGIGSCTDEYIYVPPTYENIPVTHIGRRAFYADDSIKNIVLSEQIAVIDELAFYGSSLSSIVIPSGVTTVGNSALGNCGNLTQIEFPDTVTSFGESVLTMCHNLKSVKLPQNLTAIPQSTFFTCTKLITVVLPSNISEIGDYAFGGCGSLTINIPSTVNYIGTNAFWCLDNLHVTYAGSKSDWENIEKGYDWIYGTSYYVIHCSDGDITK